MPGNPVKKCPQAGNLYVELSLQDKENPKKFGKVKGQCALELTGPDVESPSAKTDKSTTYTNLCPAGYSLKLSPGPNEAPLKVTETIEQKKGETIQAETKLPTVGVQDRPATIEADKTRMHFYKFYIRLLKIVSVDKLFAPGLEELDIVYNVQGLEDENVLLTITGKDYTGDTVFERPLTTEEKVSGNKKKLKWDGQASKGAVNRKFISFIYSPFKVVLKVEKKPPLNLELKDEKPTSVELASLELKVDTTEKLIANDPDQKVLTSSTVKFKRKAGAAAVTPVEVAVAYSFTPDGANTTAALSHIYSGTKTLGKSGDASAIYWATHPDNTSSSTDGYKTVCTATTSVAAGAKQGIASIWFKPSTVGGNKYKVKAQIFAANGTTVLATKESAQFTIWRKITLKPYEMAGQPHITDHGTPALMATFYKPTTFVIYELGTVTTLAGTFTTKYVGLWDHATLAPLNWATHSAKIAAETPTATEKTDALGPAGAAQIAARAAVQTKCNAWRTRIETAYNSGLNNWAKDAGVPVNSMVAVELEHPKYSADAPAADGITAEWTDYPWLRITVEGRTIHPDQKWVLGQGLSYAQRAYILDKMTAARTRVSVAHEAGHETKNQFKRLTFGPGDHSAPSGLMDPTGSQNAFTAREIDILKGLR